MTGGRGVVELLRGSSVLGRLDEPALLKLVQAGSRLLLPAGSRLVQAGDAGDAAFVLLEGELEVRRQARDGREIRITALKPGAVVGEMAVIDGAPRSADVFALRRSELWRIPRGALLTLLAEDAGAALVMLAELSRRLRLADRDLEDARLLDLGGRLARLLLNERSPRNLVSLTQVEMARRLGHSREKVNRKLAAWSRAGWITVTREGVRVLDAGRLSEI